MPTRRPVGGMDPMFDVDAHVVASPKTATPTNGKPSWTRYRGKTRIPCDDCVLVLHEQRGQGPAPLSARWRLKQDGAERLLCPQHADQRRALAAERSSA